MFASWVRTLRTFSTVVFGCLALAACGKSALGEAGVSALVVSGEPAPGLDEGYLLESFDLDYTMGAAGHVAFHGSANIANGRAGDRKQVLWFGRPGGLEPIAVVGDRVPGLSDDARISSFAGQPHVITKSGRLGFLALTSSAGPNMSPQALLTYVGGKLQKVIATGDAVPLSEEDKVLLRISQFAMTDEGVLFMGEFARRKSALWFWDFRKLRLVVADGETFTIGEYRCTVRSVASTNIDVNRAGQAVFRLSLGGSECPRGGLIAWDAASDALMPAAMNRAPIADGQNQDYQSVTGDARIGDAGQIMLHAVVYSRDAEAPGAKDSTLFQPVIGNGSQRILTKETPLDGIKLTHAISADGMAPISEQSAVHFARSNRDRIILRTAIGPDVSHAVIAHTGTTLDGQIAGRIGDAHANRSGDVAFVSFIDHAKRGGQYLQEVWFSSSNGDLRRLAYPGQAVLGRDGETIEGIFMSNQSHEPKMHNTQGGRSRGIADSGAVLFSGRLRKGSGWHNALFVAVPQ